MSEIGLAKRLARAIEASGKTKAQVAREAPIDAGHLRKLLSGSVLLGRRKAEDLARVLDVQPSWLLGMDAPGEGGTGAPREDVSPYAIRMGAWFEGLPDDIQAVTYFLGVCLSDPEEFQRLAGVARQTMKRRGPGIPVSTGTARTSKAGATRGGRRTAAS